MGGFAARYFNISCLCFSYRLVFNVRLKGFLFPRKILQHLAAESASRIQTAELLNNLSAHVIESLCKGFWLEAVCVCVCVRQREQESDNLDVSPVLYVSLFSSLSSWKLRVVPTSQVNDAQKDNKTSEQRTENKRGVVERFKTQCCHVKEILT